MCHGCGVALSRRSRGFAASGTVVLTGGAQDVRSRPLKRADVQQGRGPIMYRKLVTCHRRAEIAPMSFITVSECPSMGPID